MKRVRKDILVGFNIYFDFVCLERLQKELGYKITKLIYTYEYINLCNWFEFYTKKEYAFVIYIKRKF